MDISLEKPRHVRGFRYRQVLNKAARAWLTRWSKDLFLALDGRWLRTRSFWLSLARACLAWLADVRHAPGCARGYAIRALRALCFGIVSEGSGGFCSFPSRSLDHLTRAPV